jgi:hypothetical protein
MRSKLDLIEEQLRNFIENSVHLFPWSSRQHLLVRRIVGALQESLEGKTQSLRAPSIYTVYIDPLHYSEWQGRQEMFDELALVLQEAARDAGVYFTNQPVVLLAPDSSLPPDEIRVVASFPVRDGQTDALSPSDRRDNGPVDAAKNAFLILEGTRIFPLDQAVINIGRRLDNHIVIDDPRISRAHAQLRAIRGRYVLFDLNSTGGTTVNGQPITQQTLKAGDVISLSGHTLIYGEDNASSSGDTAGYSPSIPSTSE